MYEYLIGRYPEFNGLPERNLGVSFNRFINDFSYDKKFDEAGQRLTTVMLEARLNTTEIEGLARELDIPFRASHGEDAQSAAQGIVAVALRNYDHEDYRERGNSQFARLQVLLSQRYPKVFDQHAHKHSGRRR